MTNLYIVRPIKVDEYSEEVNAYLEYYQFYLPVNPPPGRYPTYAELRIALHKLGFKFDEEYGDIRSEKDGTSVPPPRANGADADKPVKLSFERGGTIVLDIVQKLSNKCGSFMVADGSGAVAVLIVPDSIFGTVSQEQDGFVAVIAGRLPVMIERLENASILDALFLLSQIRQALSSVYDVWQHELFQITHKGLPVYAKYLNHDDARVRFLAFDLIATLKQEFFKYADSLAKTINNENDVDTKTRMIWSIQYFFAERYTNDVDQWTQALVDTLLEASENPTEARSVRLAATNMLARAKLGFLTSAMRETLIEALVQPENYQTSRDSVYSIVENALKSIKHLMLDHRIAILLEALPRMTYAQDAHEVLHALLDNVFYGEIRDFRRSSLLDTQIAERPEVGQTKFRDNLSKNWHYPANPLKITVSELRPFQREILETVIALDLPWMVHSNLLEKYGLPATRSELRALLNDQSD